MSDALNETPDVDETEDGDVRGMPEPDPVPEFERVEYGDAATMRDGIFATDDIPEELVPCPEWKVDVLVKGMRGADSVSIMEEAAGPEDRKGKGDSRGVDMSKMYPDIVILTAHHPQTGERLFQRGDRKALLAKSGAALNRLAMKGMKLSGLTKEAEDEAGKDS